MTRNPETVRLEEDAARKQNWKRWGPYLAERQWGTVREDYSEDGTCWDYFTHEQSRSRAYRWGEDGLLGITDRQCRLCFSVALWNEKDPILKERLFGLTGPEGNHGEDVKECYYYLDSTPTHSYLKGLYKYPHAEFPYARLAEESRKRGKADPEFELEQTGAFNESRYFDVQVEYAKASPNDILIRLSVTNRGPEAAPLHLLPTLWFRNTWSWGCTHEGCEIKPRLTRLNDQTVGTSFSTAGDFQWSVAPGADGKPPELLFTENESNSEQLWKSPNATPYVKDAFHRRVIQNDSTAVNPKQTGTKTAAHYRFVLKPGETRVIESRLTLQSEVQGERFGESFNALFQKRIQEADQFYQQQEKRKHSEDAQRVARQAYAGLLWSKQFYHYSVKDWIAGDSDQPKPPESRLTGRNRDWQHLFNRDIISMPDKWEYPWYAAWDLAFHVVAFAKIDSHFAKEQLLLLMREWYMHPNGQIPAYEFAFGDVNPPVHAWACWRVYKMTAPAGKRDRTFLARAFHKLLLNFTWWVNRKDPEGRNIFAGGFLGLDNIGVFDRSKPLPSGGHMEQADGTAWMAFYCLTMLNIALELASEDPSYEDVASKFFEHFVAIVAAMNTLGGSGLWDELDGFYYDKLRLEGESIPLRVRSIVGIIPLFAVELLHDSILSKLSGFTQRMDWFLKHEHDLAEHVTRKEKNGLGRLLLAIPSQKKLTSVLRYLLDEGEFLSEYGIRSLSQYHSRHPYRLELDGQRYEVKYDPGESTTGLFGGNSNWRGPIWMPINYLLIEALERYHQFYGDEFQVECPVGSGKFLNLREVARVLSHRLSKLFLQNEEGRRPCHGEDPHYAKDPAWKDLILFYEYFHGETGQGLGASHQTGWTALVARLIEDVE